MRIALVIGHNPQSQGARRVTDGESEYVWNGKIADRIHALDPGNIRIFRRTPGPGEIGRVYREVAAWRPACAVEMHFNGSEYSSSHGCETIYGRSAASKALAAKLQHSIQSTLGNRDRGLKPRYNGRGSTAVNQTSQPTALIEPYFGTNAAECRLAGARMDELAVAILNGARAFLGAGMVVQPEEVDPMDAHRQRLADTMEEIGDACVAALATGYSPDLPDDVKRQRWKLAEIFHMVSKGDNK